MLLYRLRGDEGPQRAILQKHELELLMSAFLAGRRAFIPEFNNMLTIDDETKGFVYSTVLSRPTSTQNQVSTTSVPVSQQNTVSRPVPHTPPATQSQNPSVIPEQMPPFQQDFSKLSPLSSNRPPIPISKHTDKWDINPSPQTNRPLSCISSSNHDGNNLISANQSISSLKRTFTYHSGSSGPITRSNIRKNIKSPSNEASGPTSRFFDSSGYPIPAADKISLNSKRISLNHSKYNARSPLQLRVISGAISVTRMISTAGAAYTNQQESNEELFNDEALKRHLTGAGTRFKVMEEILNPLYDLSTLDELAINDYLDLWYLSWNLDMFELTFNSKGHPLYFSCMWLFQYLDIFSKLNVDKVVFQQWILVSSTLLVFIFWV